MSKIRLARSSSFSSACIGVLVAGVLVAGPAAPATPPVASSLAERSPAGALPSGEQPSGSAVESQSVGALAVRAGFRDVRIASIGSPTAIAFTRDGRMLVTTQQGLVRVIRNGKLLRRVALDLRSVTCSNSERGLLGVAADPHRGSRFVYLFYTRRGSAGCPTSTVRNPPGGPRHRVSRFVLRSDDTIDRKSEKVLLKGIYSPAGNHNGGDLAFGKNGYLYVSTGDGGCDYGGSGCGGANNAARERNVPIGKILRITRFGNIPSSNPYTGSGTARCNAGAAPRGKICREMFARGLRNPFRMAFDPNSTKTRFWINDVGQHAWEEVDAGKARANYGWNVREGHCANTGSQSSCGRKAPSSYKNPVFDYGHSTGCRSITGGAFVPRHVWPSRFDGAYLFGDFVCGRIMMRLNGKRINIVTGLGSGGPVHLEFGPYGDRQALYYTSYSRGGEIRRLTRTVS